MARPLSPPQLIDRIAEKMRRQVDDVPVGFKWFVDGLLDASLCCGVEECAGASFSRLDGSVWTIDKDGFILALLPAEITAKTAKDPCEIYSELTKEFGELFYDRIEAKATRKRHHSFALYDRRTKSKSQSFSTPHKKVGKALDYANEVIFSLNLLIDLQKNTFQL